MVEKVKLGLWDFFAYILSGGAVAISALIHLLVLKIVTFEQLTKIPSAVSVVIGLLAILILGLLLEPLSNIAYSLSRLLITKPGSGWRERTTKKWHNSIGFKNWDESIKESEKKAKELCPVRSDYVDFQYCKNFVMKRTGGEQFHSFLGKYGFYRNLVVLLAANAISCPFIYSWRTSLITSIVLFTFAILYNHRCRVFYRHMSVTVFTQYIDLASASTKDSQSEE